MKAPRFDTDGECQICGGSVRMGLAELFDQPNRLCYHHECSVCGFVRILSNDWDYRTEGFTESSTLGPRVGQEHHRGREFHMAMMGTELLARNDLDVLILGAGLSVDWKHIDELDSVRSVTTADLDNFSGCPNFVTLDGRGDRRYDIVLACEVVEHLTDPAAQIADLCADVAADGLAILSTNIYDGTDLGQHLYAFIPGHVSYYTPEAMICLAEQNGMEVDFRIPRVAVEMAGPRKRYVLLSKSPEVIAQTGRYFSSRWYAPSESNPKLPGGP